MLRTGDGGVAINHRFDLGPQSSGPLGWRHQKIQSGLNIVVRRPFGTAPWLAPGRGRPAWRWLRDIPPLDWCRRHQGLNPMRCE